MKDLLTLVVPLLDRHHLTHRVLQNLNRQKCEFKIIVADGSLTEFNQERLKQGVYYDNLDIDYFYNGHDFDIHRYMNKMHNAFQKISTPFAMIFDNDDLIDLSGIRRGVYFLSNNLDYSTYRNDIRTIEFAENYVEIKDTLYTHPSIEQGSARERALDCVSHFNSFNYAIFRTEQIKCFFEIMDSVKNNDFQLFSKSLAYFFSCSGKCKRLFDESYYYFIPGSSILQTGSKIHRFSEWIETKFWERSSAIMISMIAGISSHMHQEDIRKDFSKAFVSEACQKAGLEFSRYKNLDYDIESSKKFDIAIKQILSKYSFEDKEYSCELTKASSNEEFVKSLNI